MMFINSQKEKQLDNCLYIGVYTIITNFFHIILNIISYFYYLFLDIDTLK